MILLALGTNLGDRKANLETALAKLGQGDGAVLRLLRVSSVYESAALLKDDAPEEWDIPYYNIVVAAESALPPQELLAAVKRIEDAMGRRAIGLWAPRLIDIDILAHGTHVLHDDTLTLPHAQMLLRDFVMVPLAEIDPHWHHPDTGSPMGAASAHEWLAQKGMVAGEGLMRTEVRLQWQTG